MLIDPVVLQQKVVIGEALSSTVASKQIPENPKYSYALVNKQRVIVEPSSRKIIQMSN